MQSINMIIQLFTSFMSCLIIKSYLDDSLTSHVINTKINIIWVGYFILSLYCEKNNYITLPKLFLSAVGVLIICTIMYSGKLYKKLTMVFLYHFIWIAIEMLLGYTVMAFIIVDDYANFELLCSIISKIILLALVKIVPLFIEPSIECDLSNRYRIMLIVLPIISSVVVYNIFLITSKVERQDLVSFSAVSSSLILVLNLLVYDIYIKLLEQTEIRRKNTIYEKQICLFQEQINVKEAALLNDKIIKDKFHHQLSFIKELVYQKELSQLNEFIDGIMRKEQVEKSGPSNSGNILLDYIINSKCEVAQKNNIVCTVRTEVPYKFSFLDGDICIIIGNALDNAIEGALKYDSERYIYIEIIFRKNNLFIKIENSFDGNIKRNRHGHLISMKSDLTRHGLGLALIEKSVEKYNGLVNCDIDGHKFTLTVLLYS